MKSCRCLCLVVASTAFAVAVHSCSRGSDEPRPADLVDTSPEDGAVSVPDGETWDGSDANGPDVDGQAVTPKTFLVVGGYESYSFDTKER